MVDLSRPWPLGLGEKRWRLTVGAAVVLLVVAAVFDRQLSLLVQSSPDYVRNALAEITPYGESGWILYPSAGLFALTAVVALFVRWKLMRTMLWQFAGIYAFFFLGVGLPPTQPSLGTLVRAGNEFLFSGDWWISILPCGVLVALSLSVNLVGDWLRDVLNPKLSLS